MKAAVIDGFGSADVFSYRDVEDPKAGEGELVIKVEACGINRYDLYMRMGAVFTDLSFPHILGADVSGVVAAVGQGVDDWQVGDRAVPAAGFALNPKEWDIVPENHAPSFEVLGTHTWGGNAEYVRMPARFVVRDTTGLPAAEVAAMPLVLMTAMNAVKSLAQVKAGDRVLVSAGASGSGNACIQIARAYGAEVATTVGSSEKFDIARRAGATEVINYNEENFADRVLDWTEGQGVDAVIDNVGGSIFEDNLRALRNGGAFVNFGLVGGISAKLNFRDLFFKRHRLLGSFMGSMDGLREGLDMMADGRVKAFVDRTYPLSEIGEAHKYIESRQVQGKVVLDV